MEMYTLRTRESNTLILVFSGTGFLNPVLEDNNREKGREIFPRSLARNRFEAWLSENRASADDFTDIQVPLEIFAR